MPPAYRFAIFFDSADATASYEHAELERPLTTGETVAPPLCAIIKQSEPGEEPGRARGHLRRPSWSVAASLKFKPRGSGRPSCPRWIEA